MGALLILLNRELGLLLRCAETAVGSCCAVSSTAMASTNFKLS